MGITPALKDANFAWICMDCNNVDQSARHITHTSYIYRERVKIITIITTIMIITTININNNQIYIIYVIYIIYKYTFSVGHLGRSSQYSMVSPGFSPPVRRSSQDVVFPEAPPMGFTSAALQSYFV